MRPEEASPPPTAATPLPEEKRRYAVIIALVIVFVGLGILFYAAFFWPTLYDIATINRGHKIYAIRINRITGNVLYFDGEQWRNSPVPEIDAPEPPAFAPEKKAIAAGQEMTPALTLRPDAEGSSSQQEAQTSARSAGKAKTFAVQIKAFNNPDEAKSMIAELKKTGMDFYSVAVPLGHRWIWHRVLIGRFEDTHEASKFMQKYKIKDSYPDGFIQTLSP